MKMEVTLLQLKIKHINGHKHTLQRIGTKYAATMGKIAKRIYRKQDKMIGGVLGTKQVLLPAKKAPDIFRESMKLENFKTEDKLYQIPDLSKAPVITHETTPSDIQTQTSQRDFQRIR